MSTHEGERMPPADAAAPFDLAAQLVRRLTDRGLTVATAESLTGGRLAAAIVDIPGASLAFLGGIVAYSTELKRSLLGVDARLLSERGAVDGEVARQMADGVRRACQVGGRPADVGVSTTGVAGPDPQDGRAPGTAFVGVAFGNDVEAITLDLRGDRAAIRSATVHAALDAALARLARA